MYSDLMQEFSKKLGECDPITYRSKNKKKLIAGIQWSGLAKNISEKKVYG